jgi:lipopolysaccharide transport system permease protein
VSLEQQEKMTTELEYRQGAYATPLPAAANPAGQPRTLIRPPRGWQLLNLRELWQFRELLFFLTWRDVKVRYKQTALGAAWAVLQPAMMMVVFTIFFSRMSGVQSGDVPYPLFAYAGLLPWTFFATAIANAGNSIVGSERLITKVYFPRMAIPLASVLAAVVDFITALGLLFAMMLWYGVAPGPGLLLLPVIFGAIFLVAAGVGTLLAALNVRYRDFRYIIPFMVQLGLFATPTVYMPLETGRFASGPLHTLAFLNPLTGLIGAFRTATLGQPIPWTHLLASTAMAAAVFILGCLYFRRVEHGFGDII